MADGTDGGGPVAGEPPGGGGTTGRHLVLLALEPGAVEALRSGAGLAVATTADAPVGALGAEEVQGADGVVFDRLGVAVVRASPEQLRALDALVGRGLVRAVEAERVVRVASLLPPPPDPPTAPLDYLRGYRDGVSALVEALGAGRAAPVPLALDEAEATWGLQAVAAASSARRGRGVAVAVLDTGVDLAHPDVAGRDVSARSFVAGEGPQDGHGHGTHCAGTACGPQRPAQGPRYGVAPEARIFAGKVLADSGSGTDRGILAGLNWAVASGCRVASLSLGSPAPPGAPHSAVFEAAARRALRAGTAVVAAAGNDSRRDAGVVAPVSHPANCPSIAAVGAVDRLLAVAAFSNRGLSPEGGQVDVVAPGVDVASSWTGGGYRTLSGTSMAAPHAAGVLALLAEADPDASTAELLGLLTRTARRLPGPSADVGAGIVQAPR